MEKKTDIDIYDYLKYLGVADYQVREHPSVTTVDEAMKHLSDLPGIKCKNLILKDKTESYYLVIADINTNININQMGKTLGLKELKMAKPDILDYLGIEKGSVSPFALLNDRDRRFNVIFDKNISDDSLVSFHPLRNDRTLILTCRQLMTFLSALKNKIIVY